MLRNLLPSVSVNCRDPQRWLGEADATKCIVEHRWLKSLGCRSRSSSRSSSCSGRTRTQEPGARSRSLSRSRCRRRRKRRSSRSISSTNSSSSASSNPLLYTQPPSQNHEPETLNPNSWTLKPTPQNPYPKPDPAVSPKTARSASYPPFYGPRNPP